MLPAYIVGSLGFGAESVCLCCFVLNTATMFFFLCLWHYSELLRNRVNPKSKEAGRVLQVVGALQVQSTVIYHTATLHL